MTEEVKQIINEIAQAIERQQLSIDELVNRTGLQRNTINRYVIKKSIKKPTVRTVMILAKAVGIDTNDDISSMDCFDTTDYMNTDEYIREEIKRWKTASEDYLKGYGRGIYDKMQSKGYKDKYYIEDDYAKNEDYCDGYYFGYYAPLKLRREFKSGYANLILPPVTRKKETRRIYDDYYHQASLHTKFDKNAVWGVI